MYVKIIEDQKKQVTLMPCKKHLFRINKQIKIGKNINMVENKINHVALTTFAFDDLLFVLSLCPKLSITLYNFEKVCFLNLLCNHIICCAIFIFAKFLITSISVKNIVLF